MDAATALKHKWVAGESASTKNLFAKADEATKSSATAKEQFVQLNQNRATSRQESMKRMEAAGGNPPMEVVAEPGKSGCACVIA